MGGAQRSGSIREGKGKGGETLKVRRGDHSGPRIGKLQECRALCLRCLTSTLKAVASYQTGRRGEGGRSWATARRGEGMSNMSSPAVNKIIHLFIILHMCWHAVLCTWRSEDNFMQKFFPPTFCRFWGLNLGC